MKQIGELRCDDLVLKDFSEDNLSEEYVSWLNDPEVVRFSRQRFDKHTADSCNLFFREMQSREEYFVAVFVEKDGLQHIGNITTATDEHNGVVDLAILIGNRDYWGMGYGRKAWKLLINKLLESSDIRMVTAGCMSENKAMVRIMMASGMEEYYTRKNYFVFNGKYCDSVHFILKKK